MRVLKVEPNKVPYVDDIPNTYEALRDYVGGYIEYVGLDEDTYIVCNEEGKLMGLTPNRYIFDGADVVCGNFLIVGDVDDEGNNTSLTDEQIHTWSEHFMVPPVKIDPDDIRFDFTFISW